MNQPADTNDLPVRVRRAAWLARAAFLLVFAINVQCAASFVLWPDAYAPSFEVAGVPGAAAVQGLGIAFLMWNATYPAVIASPLRFRAVAVIVLVQQAIGLAGESWLRFGLPAGHAALSASIERFILFDAAGLVLMAAAFGWLLWVKRATPRARNGKKMPNSETIAPLRRARHACIHEGHFDDQVLRERAFFAAPAARSETSEFKPFSPPAAPSDARDRTRSEKDAAQPENSSHDIAKSDMLAAEPKKKQRGAS